MVTDRQEAAEKECKLGVSGGSGLGLAHGTQGTCFRRLDGLCKEMKNTTLMPFPVEKPKEIT